MNGMLFSKILQMSLLGSYTFAVVCIVRQFLKRIGRKYCYYLWFIVFLNLCVPISVYGSFSLIPKAVQQAAYFPQISEEAENQTEAEPVLESMVLLHDMSMKKYEADIFGETVQIKEQASLMENEPSAFQWRELLPMAEKIWILGIFLLGMYSLIVSIRFWRCLQSYSKRTLSQSEGIMEAEDLPSPLVWGILRPDIYLPADMDKEERSYIVLHEMYHRKRKDHIAKLLFYTITLLHWFNPMAWIAYHLCCRDMEISCDEAVLERSEENTRKAYAKSLLKFAAKQNHYVYTPLTFGEPSVRSRIENVLKYRKKGAVLSLLAALLTVVIGAGLLFHPKAAQTDDAADLSDTDAPTAASDSLESEVCNNGGEIIRVGSSLYYDQGNRLYSDGRYLYKTAVYEDGSPSAVYQYALDGSGFLRMTEGTVIGMSKDLKMLYYISADEDGNWQLYRYDLTAMEASLVFENGAVFFYRTDQQVFCQREEDEKIYVEYFDLEKGTQGELVLQNGAFPGDLTDLYVEGDEITAAVGTFEGSAGYFYGNFYYENVSTGRSEEKHLTDADSFDAFDDYLYYQKYDNFGASGNDLYRVPMNLSREELLAEGETLLEIDRENQRLITEKDGQLFWLSCDGKERELLLDAFADISWEAVTEQSEADKISFTELNVIDEVLFVKAEYWGYREGNGWRDSLLGEQYLKIRLDGSGYQNWDPEALLAEQELFAWLNDPVPGKPISDLSQWNMTDIKDVRETFQRLSYVPEEGAENETWLLGKTEHYTLYGKGNQDQMLLEHQGHYAEILYTFTSNYMIPLALLEADVDHDGTEELAITLNVKHGTGVYIDTLFLADSETDGELYVYQFLEEDCIGQFQEHISYERKENGIQAMLDGKPAGSLLEDEEGMEPYSSVGCGMQLRFYYENGQITAGAELQFYDQENVGYYGSNGSEICAVVNWSDGRFILSDFLCRQLE